MSKQSVIFSLLCAAGICRAQIDRRPCNDAETEFAKYAGENGTRAAFLKYLADDAVLFSPGPVNGKELWTARPENKSALLWHWQVFFGTSGADICVDSGPWDWKKDKASDQVNAHGHFVSLWRKQADGNWKVELDIGIEHPPGPDGDHSAYIPATQRLDRPPEP